MVDFAQRLPIPGEWLVGAVGAGLVVVGGLHFAYQLQIQAPLFGALLRTALVLVPGVGVVGIAVWLASSGFDADLRAAVAVWCVIGLGSFLALTLLIELNPSGGTDEPLPSALIASSVGAFVGAGNGINQSRAVRNAREAERARIAAELAARQNERLDELASAISHDVRSPIRLIKSYLQLARRQGEVGEAVEEYLDEVEMATDRLAELLNDLETLTHHGQEVTEPDLVDFERAVTSAWNTALTEDAQLHARIEGTQMYADETRLKSVLGNLFENAVDHGDASVVEVGLLSDAGGFFVEDDGTGIASHDPEKLFESGYTTDMEAGTGFGLAIVNWVATAHGWEIAATNGSGGGARFEVTGVTFGQEDDRVSEARSVLQVDS